MTLVYDWTLSSDQPLYFCRGYVENGRREGECQVEICPGPEIKASVHAEKSILMSFRTSELVLYGIRDLKIFHHYEALDQ